MSKLDPEKLYVEFRDGVTPTEPVVDRKYTLTHSDLTAELFLTIGLQYALDKITAMRDEVLAEWRISDHNISLYRSSELDYQIILYGYVYVDGEFGNGMIALRDAIFRKELPLALEAIRYGDNELFVSYPELDKAQIWIYFDSANPEYHKLEYWGTPQEYVLF